MRRTFPPMIGAVGHDLGHRPSLAIVIPRRLREEEEPSRPCAFSLECWALELDYVKCGAFAFGVDEFGVRDVFGIITVDYHTEYSASGADPELCDCGETETADVTYILRANAIIAGEGLPDCQFECEAFTGSGLYDHETRTAGDPDTCAPNPFSLTLDDCPLGYPGALDGGGPTVTHDTGWTADLGFGPESVITRGSMDPTCGNSEYTLSIDLPDHRRWTYEESEDASCSRCADPATWVAQYGPNFYDVTLSDPVPTSAFAPYFYIVGTAGPGNLEGYYTYTLSGFFGGTCRACLFINIEQTSAHWTSALVRITNTDARTLTIRWNRYDWPLLADPDPELGPCQIDYGTEEAPTVPTITPGTISLGPDEHHDVYVDVDPLGANAAAYLADFTCETT
jgi:hypothetical protein